jgi:hypothetical protein
MVKCAHCKTKITLAPNGFSGIPRLKFCMTCWSKIYTIWQSERHKRRDPKLNEWASQIKVVYEEECT